MHISLEPKAEKSFKTFPKFIQLKLMKKMAKLENFPLLNADIKKFGDGSYRMRVGDYRIRFYAKREKDLILIYEINTRGKISYAKG